MYIFIVYNPIQFNIHYLSSFYHFTHSPRYSILFFHTKILSKFLPSFSQNRTKFTSNNVKTNQTFLSTQEPNKKKKKEKTSTKKKKKKEEGSPGTSSGIWRSVAGVLRRKKTPVEFRRGRGWLARRVGTYPLVKMDGLSPYKSNGIFDRGRVSAGRGSMVGLQGCRVRGLKDGKGVVGGVLQDGGYKGWFRAREGCGWGNISETKEDREAERKRYPLLEGCFAPMVAVTTPFLALSSSHSLLSLFDLLRVLSLVSLPFHPSCTSSYRLFCLCSPSIKTILPLFLLSLPLSSLTRPRGALGSVHESINVGGDWWKWTRRGREETDDREIVENRMAKGGKWKQGVGDDDNSLLPGIEGFSFEAEPLSLLPLPRWYQGWGRGKAMEICQRKSSKSVAADACWWIRVNAPKALSLSVLLSWFWTKGRTIGDTFLFRLQDGNGRGIVERGWNEDYRLLLWEIKIGRLRIEILVRE